MAVSAPTKPRTDKEAEELLARWVRPSSDAEDARRDQTEKEIKVALTASKALSGVNYHVFAKGSYANNTNVRLDSDADFGVEFEGYFYYDETGAPGDIQSAIRSALPPYTGGYTPTMFKAAVEQALVDAYGRSAVHRGNVALKVRERRTTLPADVVPCFQYRRIVGLDASGNMRYHRGIRIFPDKGSYFDNWPDQQKSEGNAKNNRTGTRFKKMVRAFKRAENVIAATGAMPELASFLMECLVYNVDDKMFGNRTFLEDYKNMLATIYHATTTDDACRKWVEVNGLKWLFGPHQKWTREQANELALKSYGLVVPS